MRPRAPHHHASETNNTDETTTRRRRARGSYQQGTLDIDVPRTCTRCGLAKPVDEFSPSTFAKSGYQSYCRQCGLVISRISKGVHPADADRVCPDGQRCEICDGDGGNRGLFFDHDHATGRFRGWLCHHCNAAIGHLGDDPARLRSAAAYVERSSVIHPGASATTTT
jgi:hypothetical protein